MNYSEEIKKLFLKKSSIYVILLNTSLEGKVLFKFWKILKIYVTNKYKSSGFMDIKLNERGNVYINSDPWHILISNFYRKDISHSYNDFKEIIQKSKMLNDILQTCELEATKEYKDSIEKPRTRELISKPMFDGAPLHCIDEYFCGKLIKFRSYHIEFDIFLKDLGQLLQKQKNKYFDNLKQFIKNNPHPNWVSPRDCMFTVFVKLFNLNFSPFQAYEYIKVCLRQFKKMEKTKYKLNKQYEVITKRSRWDGKQREWIKASISPINHEDFWFYVSLESLQVEDEINDMKMHHDVEIIINTSDKTFEDALMLFEFYQDRGFYRGLCEFVINQLADKGIIREIATGESAGLKTHLFEIIDENLK